MSLWILFRTILLINTIGSFKAAKVRSNQTNTETITFGTQVLINQNPQIIG
jgi:hypothetical protein